jgi:hypothetical protein
MVEFVLPAFGVRRTTVLAEPSVTEIEEVVCLIHGREIVKSLPQSKRYRP